MDFDFSQLTDEQLDKVIYNAKIQKEMRLVHRQEELWQKVIDAISEYTSIFGAITVNVPHDEWEVDLENSNFDTAGIIDI